MSKAFPYGMEIPTERLQRRNRQVFPDLKKLMNPEQLAHFEDQLKIVPEFGEEYCVGIDLNRKYFPLFLISVFM